MSTTYADTLKDKAIAALIRKLEAAETVAAVRRKKVSALIEDMRGPSEGINHRLLDALELLNDE